jgi:hypothetical protein
MRREISANKPAASVYVNPKVNTPNTTPIPTPAPITEWNEAIKPKTLKSLKGHYLKEYYLFEGALLLFLINLMIN